MTSRAPQLARAASAAALAAVAIGTLASCSGGASAQQPASTAAEHATGTWTATGDYRTPGGQESVTVPLTAKGGTVTAVEVTGSGGSPNSQQYQSQCISGISGAVVGRPLATLDVGAVSGSSLTGQGFDAAVDTIRADAA